MAVAAANGVGGDGGARWGRERDPGGSEGEGESEEGPGDVVALRETSRGGGGSQAGRRWPGRVATRAGRVPVSFWRGRKTTGGVAVAGWAGQLQCWAGLATR